MVAGRDSEVRAGVVALVIAVVAALSIYARSGEDVIVLGKIREVSASKVDAKQAKPKIALPGPTSRPVSQIAAHLAAPPALAAGPYKPPPGLGFAGAVNVPKDLHFFLVIGSDARPGEDMSTARADSIHIAAIDPKSRKGTILGLPRDSYVNVPGHGKQKINAALPLGGPQLLAQTVRDTTGLPVTHYALTGFAGMKLIADELGGVDINVPYRMQDRYSGAYFEPGWQHMNGDEVLAFSRCRYGVPGGDFGRSENHGRVMIHTLQKMRKEVDSDKDMRHWLNVLYKHARLDMSIKDAFELAKLARQVVPSHLVNVVASGNGRTMNGQSVIELNESAYALFRDVGGDAYADGNIDREPPAPAPPKPKPKPTPTPIVPLPSGVPSAPD